MMGLAFRRPAAGAASAALLATLLAVVPAVQAQTKIEPHSNSYSVEDDVKLGQEAAAEVRQQYPLLQDEEIDSYVKRLGRQLVDAIPADLRHPEFQYSFQVVNLKEINAFALPGGPMFLNRGMLDAAKTDGEVAGVMAHELSHVILRHGTAQATKGQKFQIGAIAGQILGAVVGGRTGSVIAQGSQIGLGTYFLKYSREYEKEADLLGAQLMARAGYDPRQMAEMFKTIEAQGGANGPEWLSDHPNPGNRYEAIIQEARQLTIARNESPLRELDDIHARLRKMPPAMTTEEAARAAQQRGGPVPASARTGPVPAPAAQYQTYQPGNFMRISVPANWQQLGTGNTVTYAPQGGYLQASDGRSAFTHGVEIGVVGSTGRSLQENTEQLLRGFANANPQLRRQSGYSRSTISGQPALTTTLSNVSDVTGETERIDLTTVQLSDGSMLFMIGVAPQNEARQYVPAFNRVRQSIQLAQPRR
jgi:Zn-dependent protease with chaperone function